MRQKKMPELKKVLAQQQKARPQTPDELLAIVRMWNAAYGGKELKAK